MTYTDAVAAFRVAHAATLAAAAVVDANLDSPARDMDYGTYVAACVARRACVAAEVAAAGVCADSYRNG
jgi:hypothetical protein